MAKRKVSAPVVSCACVWCVCGVCVVESYITHDFEKLFSDLFYYRIQATGNICAQLISINTVICTSFNFISKQIRSVIGSV